ncbi:paralemmin 1a isoform X4 [Astyanax mexicanus]|uniref:paralemmin 1a isoform X4 n=1 Tax=Astyanax mexicanus TaxID=7994 RepID=UPI0020CAF0EB|nr:paralemmin 1a isoform X4 [Astyanax mexicanus]
MCLLQRFRMSEALSQQERLQAIAEKRKKQTEIENKKRQLEDDRRQLQHLKSKALRERWLMDGAPSAGSEEDEAKKQLQEDEAKTKGLEEAILRMEQELEELETGVSATSTKENLSDVAQQEETKAVDNKVVGETIKVIREIKEVKVHVSPRLEKSRGDSDMMRAVVHEVGAVANGVHQLSSSEVEELIHKADEITYSDGEGTTPKRVAESETVAVAVPAEGEPTPIKEITGVEAKPPATTPQPEVNEASTENPVTMVFMGYQNVEDEDETKKVLGMESTTVKAELVVIEDGENKSAQSAQSEAKEEQEAPPNGGPAEPVKDQETSGEAGEPESGAGEVKGKEKQPCKCCSIM